eukprot:4077315-Prymnesium_polylepis.1
MPEPCSVGSRVCSGMRMGYLQQGDVDPVSAGEHQATSRTSPSTSSTAERSCTTSPMTPATGPAVSTTTSNVQGEERTRAPRTAVWG